MPARKSKQRRLIPDRLKLPLTLLLLITALVLHDSLWRWDQLLYDVHLRQWSNPAPDDIVLVAIDETSLSELGQWPWPRNTHAQLIKQLKEAGAKTIGLDIIFAEPDTLNPEGDKALAQAIREHGGVVLPVMVEKRRLGGQLVERLPLPQLANTAASLGHVHVELDADGIARNTYLFEGLGKPIWPHFSLAVLRLDDNTKLANLTRPDSDSTSIYKWTRAHHTLIHYIGPPGHFQHIPYAQVLKGDFPKDIFRNKIVLVGATATGLGDILPTPVSGQHRPMPGVEVHANILTTLRQGSTLEAMSPTTRLLVSGLIVLLPALLFPLLRPRASLLATVGLMIATLLLSLVLLRVASIWFPPTAVLITLAASYPLWSWRRLEETLSYLDQELDRLRDEPTLLPLDRSPDTDDAMDFIQHLIPVTGWALYDHENRKQRAWGNIPKTPPLKNYLGQWQQQEDTLWTGITTDNGLWQLGIHLEEGATCTPPQVELILNFVQQLITKSTALPENTVEMIQGKVQEVQEATANLQILRGFIDDSLAQMADGVLVISNLGKVMLFNHQAAAYLRDDNAAELLGQSLIALLKNIQIQDTNTTWTHHIAEVLFNNASIQLQANTPADRDLLIQMTPLSAGNQHLNGLIVNISDITPLKESERKRMELLGFLSHDLRSPLVSLLTYIELVRIGTRSSDTDSLIQQVEHYANKTLTLADNFIQLSRAENVNEMAMHEIDFVALANSAIDNIWPQANMKKIRIENQLPSDEIWLKGDRSLLERAIINLLGNAVKYSPSGSHIETSIEITDTYLRCHICDTGYGIEEGDIPKLFDRFKRIHREEHKQESGTGLGLSFVKTVIDNHGGKIDVSSEIGKGSCFCIQLPIVKTPLTQTAQYTIG